MAQHGGVCVGLLFLTKEVPAKHGLDAQHPEEIRGDDLGRELLRIANAAERHAVLR